MDKIRNPKYGKKTYLCIMCFIFMPRAELPRYTVIVLSVCLLQVFLVLSAEFATFLSTPLQSDTDSSFLSLPSSSGSLPAPPHSRGSASRKRLREGSSSSAESTRLPFPNTANASRNSATSSTRCTPAGTTML